MTWLSAPPRAVVTGGTRGIGRAIAERLAADGYRLLLTYRADEASARETESVLTDRGASVEMLCVDISLECDVARLVDQAGADRLDLLVNNAGGTRDGALAMMDRSDFAPLVTANLGGTLRVSLALLPLLRATVGAPRGGAMVNVSSLAGLAGKEGQAPYAATKGGIAGATRLLARVFGPEGLRVNAVAPGFIRTEMVANLPPGMTDHVLAMTASPRMGDPAEVAAAVAYLAGPGASYLNGVVLRVDGGFLR